jgi:hypothetical protein
MMSTGSDLRELPGYLDGWDYNTTLALRRELRIEVGSFIEGARLDPEASLSVVVVAFSTATWIRRRAFACHVPRSTDDIIVEFELPGIELGGTLRLRTTILLCESGPEERPFVAHLPGSVLWDDLREVRLQGDAPLFPISVVDFERAALPSGAGWHLDVGRDLNAPLHASIRLYLNASHSRVVSAFVNAGAPTPENQAVLRAVYADVARVMVEHALNQEALLERTEFDPDSLGFALGALLQRFFAGEDLNAARDQRIEHPADFGTELFAKLKVFDD